MTTNDALKSFDSRSFGIVSPCKYNALSGTSAAIPTFNVYARLSPLMYLELHVYGYIARLTEHLILTVSCFKPTNCAYWVPSLVILISFHGQVNGTQHSGFRVLELNDGRLKLEILSRSYRVSTDFGLFVEIDAWQLGTIRIPKSMVNMTEGLCGNNNGQWQDDLIDASGKDMSGVIYGESLFLDSWQVPDAENPR